jgi:murein DD-endopeptidase MepM/ murein hydrolase activator NlpD
MINNNIAIAAANKFSRLIRTLPKTHLALASAALALVFFALMLPSAEVQANRRPLPLPSEFSTDPQLDLATLTNPVINEPSLASEHSADKNWQELTVRKGDNLAKIFDRAGLSASDMNDVLQSGPEAKLLTHIFPGQKLAFQTDQDGQLVALRYEETQLKSTRYSRDDENFTAEKINREPEVRHQFAHGTVTSSFYKAGLDAGLSDGMILQLAEIFGGEIDFVLDLRANDQFVVMYDEYYLDDKKVGNGPILAASFVNQGETHSAYRYVYANGDLGYFSPEGVSMRKTFMRAPLDFIRISSPFSLTRLHPLFKTNRPHRGIDYAAPTGTPVYSAGDGRVVQSGYSDSMGNFVVIQHDGTYSTKYLHLSKRTVSVGTRVKQHQVIGAVGSTGWATGPHLHYEFLVNGVHTNPAKIAGKLPQANRIASGEQRRFSEQVHGLQTQFAAYASQNKLATAEQNNNSADSNHKSL